MGRQGPPAGLLPGPALQRGSPCRGPGGRWPARRASIERPRRGFGGDAPNVDQAPRQRGVRAAGVFLEIARRELPGRLRIAALSDLEQTPERLLGQRAVRLLGERGLEPGRSVAAPALLIGGDLAEEEGAVPRGAEALA